MAESHDPAVCRITRLPIELLELIAFFLPETPNDDWKTAISFRDRDTRSLLRSFRLTCTLFSRLTIPLQRLFHTIRFRPLHKDLPSLRQMAEHPRISAVVQHVEMYEPPFYEDLTRVSTLVDCIYLKTQNPFVYQSLASIYKYYYELQLNGIDEDVFQITWIEALSHFGRVKILTLATFQKRDYDRVLRAYGATPEMLPKTRNSSLNGIRGDCFIKFALNIVNRSGINPEELRVIHPLAFTTDFELPGSFESTSKNGLSNLRRLYLILTADKGKRKNWTATPSSIIKILQYVPHLQTLELEFDEYLPYRIDNCIELDISALHNPHLEELYLSNIRLPSKQFVDFLRRHDRLVNLFLCDCELNPETPGAWRGVFHTSQTHPSLRKTTLMGMVFGLDGTADDEISRDNPALISDHEEYLEDGDSRPRRLVERMLYEFLNCDGPWTTELARRWGPIN